MPSSCGASSRPGSSGCWASWSRRAAAQTRVHSGHEGAGCYAGTGDSAWRWWQQRGRLEGSTLRCIVAPVRKHGSMFGMVAFGTGKVRVVRSGRLTSAENVIGYKCASF